MPRLTKGMNTGEVAAAAADTWKAIRIGKGTLDSPIPPKTRLTTLVVQVTDKSRRADGFKFGLSEDEAGNHPITGLLEVDLDDHKTTDPDNQTSFSHALNMDYMATADADNPGCLWFWWQCDDVATTVRVTLHISET